MTTAAWFLFILLFPPTVGGFFSWMSPSRNVTNGENKYPTYPFRNRVYWLVCALISSVCAGVIWGGLF